MALFWLTLATVGAIVLALAGYLIAIAWELARAKANVRKIADGLEAIAGHTEPLGERIATIDGAIGRLVDGFGEIDDHMAGAAEAFQR